MTHHDTPNRRAEDQLAPLTPADSDLRDFQFMPLDVVRLRDSDIAAVSTGDEFRCAVLLWCVAWHQVPAGSLPDDDVVLSQYAGFGRVVREWQKVRDGALRGWVKCTDGRLYHPVVSEKVNEAWAGRLKHREKKEAERQRKAAERAARKAQEDANEAAQQAAHDAKHPQDTPDLSGGQTEPVQTTPPKSPAENALRGTVDSGQWTGTVDSGQLTSKPKADDDITDGGYAHPTEAPLPPRVDPAPEDNNPAIALAVKLRTWGVNATFTHPAVQDWTQREVDHDILASAVALAREQKGDAKIAPNYLVPIVEKLLNPPAKAEPKPPQQREDYTWASSNQGIDKKARELGIRVLPSHSYNDVKQMCFDKIRELKAKGAAQ